MPRALAFPLVSLVALLSLAAAGCGGDEGRSAEDWANDVCGELNTWADSVTTAIKGVTSQGLGVTSDDLRVAANQASAATTRLVDGLGEIEPPDTESAQRAQDDLRRLGDSIEQHADRARALVQDASGSGSGLVEVARSVLVEIGAAADAAQAALGTLQQAGDDLRSGIEDSDACSELRNRDLASG